MKIENKDFWEKENIIQTQEVLQKASDFETYLLNRAEEKFSKFGKIKNIKVFGCGTGREVESIAELLKPDFILASDISENMITKCNQNLIKWGIDLIAKTTTPHLATSPYSCAVACTRTTSARRNATGRSTSTWGDSRISCPQACSTDSMGIVTAVRPSLRRDGGAAATARATALLRTRRPRRPAGVASSTASPVYRPDSKRWIDAAQ